MTPRNQQTGCISRTSPTARRAFAEQAVSARRPLSKQEFLLCQSAGFPHLFTKAGMPALMQCSGTADSPPGPLTLPAGRVVNGPGPATCVTRVVMRVVAKVLAPALIHSLPSNARETLGRWNAYKPTSARGLAQ